MTHMDNNSVDINQYHALLVDVSNHFTRCLRTLNEAVSYLQKRGISGRTAAFFGLGYSPSDIHELETILARYDQSSVDATGLIITDSDTGRKYGRFRNRIMFPLHDEQGHIVGFSGRILRSTGGEPKYLNSQECPFFRKGKLLYGALNTAEDNLEERLLVVEGYVDVLSLYQGGYRSAVATMGTALSTDQVAMLLEKRHNITFCFDGDHAGQVAAARAANAMLPFLTDQVNVSFLFLPESHDPDSFVQHCGMSAFQELLLHDVVPVTSYLKTLTIGGHTIVDIEDISMCLSRARMYWIKMVDGQVRQDLMEFCCLLSGLEAESIIRAWSEKPTALSRAKVKD